MKLAKLSLAAIMAAGAFTYASATPLTDAIKGVDLSGMVRLRFYNEDRGQQNDDITTNRFRTSADFKFTIPASDTFKVIYQLSVENSNYSNGNQYIGQENYNTGVVSESLAYMNYTSNGLNVIAGRIPVQSTITTAGHGETVGDGVIATYGVGGGFTVAGAFTDNLNSLGTNGGADLVALAGIYNSDMVDVNAWFYRVTNVAKYIYTVTADVKPMPGLKIHGDYAASKLDTTGAQNHSYYNINVGYALNAFSVMGGYAATNKKAGLIYVNGDSAMASTAPVANNYSIANNKDYSAYYAKVGYIVNAKSKAYVGYEHQKDNAVANNNLNQYTVGGSYAYNKKLGFTAYYDMANFDDNTADNNEFRFEAKYSF